MKFTFNNTNKDILKELNDKKIAEYGGALAYCVLVIVTGVLGNIMTILFYGKRINKSTTNAMITYLATTDLIACFFFIDEIVEICYTINFRSAIGCKMMSFFNHWIVIASGFMLVVICVDRYRKICCSHNWQFTHFKTKLVAACVGLFSCMTAVRNFVILDVVQFNITVPYSDEALVGYYCTHTKSVQLKNVVTAFFVFDIILYVIIMAILLLLYAFVTKEIWRVHQLVKRHEQSELQSSLERHMKQSSPVNKHNPMSNSVEVSVVSTSINSMHCSDADNNDNRTPTDKRLALRIKSDSLETRTQVMNSEQKEPTDEIHKNSMNKKRSDSLATNQGTLRTHGHSHRHHFERQISVMMIVITTVSVLSYVPYFVVTMTTKRSSNTPEHEFSVGIQIALRSFMLNNAVNPYIMGIFNTEFRQFVKKSLCRMCQRESIFHFKF